jgi:hypothetical protein
LSRSELRGKEEYEHTRVVYSSGESLTIPSDAISLAWPFFCSHSLQRGYNYFVVGTGKPNIDSEQGANSEKNPRKK